MKFKEFKGLVWRHVPTGAHPLHVGYILTAGGRWNRPGEYGALYTSLTRAGAAAEYRKYIARAGAAGLAKPHDIVSLEVEVAPVVDLTDPTASPVPPGASFLTGDDPGDLAACRALADYLRAAGSAGIIAFSAAGPREANLIIYIDVVPPRNLHIDVGPDRIKV